MAMTYKNIMTIVSGILVLTVVSGCLDADRKESSRLRWQRTMDQARLQAAQQSLEEGRLTYAQHVLDGCEQCADPASDLAGQVEQLRARIYAEQNRYAKADNEAETPEEMTY
jgi:hypothetical protein